MKIALRNVLELQEFLNEQIVEPIQLSQQGSYTLWFHRDASDDPFEIRQSLNQITRTNSLSSAMTVFEGEVRKHRAKFRI